MDIDQFAQYVLSFYGVGGLYDMKATRDQVLVATGMHLSNCDKTGLEFCGDTVDREAVRDILIERFHLEFPVVA